ncbi:head-tail connector protein [Qipengyuania pacifica]|uniref:head-tail connector protein n=1 Tax=Qipengyuania pacifica TaxID=2860199 RepID=UPI00321196E7
MIALARAVSPAARALFPDNRDVFFMTPDLSGQALADLKQWLAIGVAGEDALLLRLLDTAWQICARFTGHGAAEWNALDETLRHGIVRFAAHQYRERDEGTAPLPAAIAALWRPYRPVRL